MYRFPPASFAIVPGFRAPAPLGRQLESLEDSEALRNRFFAWKGASGRRYVCSVFQAGEAAFVADVTEGLIIGVAREGAKRPVAIIRAGSAGDGPALWAMARELGVTEWHVLFCPDADAMRDLSASLLN